jgi:phytoene dehydrogenase-like protein
MEFDAVVVGSGPNGLAAAICLQEKGVQVLLLEAKETIGGGMRTEELIEPGCLHDVCSAVHPMALASPFMRKIPWEGLGVHFIHPDILAAHPIDGGVGGLLKASLSETARTLGKDARNYEQLFHKMLPHMDSLMTDLLNPTAFPKDPLRFAAFGWKGLRSAQQLARKFQTTEAKALWGGMAGHSMLALDQLGTAAIGLTLLAAGHHKGWPFVRGGTQQMANGLATYFLSLGGKIVTNTYITDLGQLPRAKAYLLDVDPKQLLQIAGHRLSDVYKWQLRRFKYGLGVYKMDWILDEAVPFVYPPARDAGVVHVGGSFDEIAYGEKCLWQGKMNDYPFVLLAQPSRWDASRAPKGKQILWGYCHTPAGFEGSYRAAIENQIERFAPGFKERILARHEINAVGMNDYNANYVGGDINGGKMDIFQLFTRPALRWSPYKTSSRGIYLCSASTPPGGGVHGMSGQNAARIALKECFGIQ